MTGRGGARRLRHKDRCAQGHGACCALPLLFLSSSAHVQLRVPLRSRHGRAHPEPAVPEAAGMAQCEPRRAQPEETFSRGPGALQTLQVCSQGRGQRASGTPRRSAGLSPGPHFVLDSSLEWVLGTRVLTGGTGLLSHEEALPPPTGTLQSLRPRLPIPALREGISNHPGGGGGAPAAKRDWRERSPPTCFSWAWVGKGG